MRIRGFAPSTPCWAEVTTAHPQRAADFYGRLFGWSLDGDRFLLNGRAVAGLRPATTGESPGWLTYLAVEDLETATERICAADGGCLSPATGRAGARTATVADAAGAAFGIWQSTGFAGAQLRGEPSAMAWPDLLTDDVPAATAFYQAAFGWTLIAERHGGEWLNPAHDSVAGLISSRPGARWQPSFQVADIDQASERSAELGAQLVTAPMEIGLGNYVEIVDPDGAAFSLTAPVTAPVELVVTHSPVTGLELSYGG